MPVYMTTLFEKAEQERLERRYETMVMAREEASMTQRSFHYDQTRGALVV